MTEPPYARRGQPISASLWNALVDFAAAQGEIHVAPPLAILNGTICWAGEFQVSHALTTSAIDAGSSTAMQSGQATLRYTDDAGTFQDRPGFNAITVWNDLSQEIPANVVIRVMFYDGKWQIFNADCLGGSS